MEMRCDKKYTAEELTKFTGCQLVSYSHILNMEASLHGYILHELSIKRMAIPDDILIDMILLRQDELPRYYSIHSPNEFADHASCRILDFMKTQNIKHVRQYSFGYRNEKYKTGGRFNEFTRVFISDVNDFNLILLNFSELLTNADNGRKTITDGTIGELFLVAEYVIGKYI